MPRSVKRPITGAIVWYFANPAPAAPQAALVCQTVDWSDATETGHFNLYVLSGAGVASAVTGVYFTQAGAVPQVVTVAAVQAGGSGYAIGHTINLSNGVVLRVLTLSTTAVATAAIVNAGSSTTASPPANPVAQVSSSGAGTGATFNLTWSTGAWCTYPRVNESTSSVQPAAMETGVAGTPEAMGPEAAAAYRAAQAKAADEDDDDDNGGEDDDDGGGGAHTVTRTRTRTTTVQRPTHR